MSFAYLRTTLAGRVSSVYRATSPTGEKVVLKYANDMLAVLREAEAVRVRREEWEWEDG
jgi:hypothetical protein